MEQRELTSVASHISLVTRDHRNMQDVRTPETAKEVLLGIAPYREVKWLLSVVWASRFQKELLLYLPTACGFELDRKKYLDLLADLSTYQARSGNFTVATIQPLVDQYWLLAVRERIVAKDFGRAWDTTRKSYHGFREEAFTPIEMLQREKRNAWDFGASDTGIDTLVRELYAAMQEQGLVGEAETSAIPAIEFEYAFSRPAGIILAVAIQAYKDFGSIRPPPPAKTNMVERGKKQLLLAATIEGYKDHKDFQPPSLAKTGTLTEGGKKLLLLASYFSAKKKAKRKSKKESLLRARMED